MLFVKIGSSFDLRSWKIAQNYQFFKASGLITYSISNCFAGNFKLVIILFLFFVFKLLWKKCKIICEMRTYLPYNNIQAAFWQKILMRCIIFCLPAKIPSSKNNWSLIGCRGWPISFFKSPVPNIHSHGWNGNPFTSFHIDVSITHSFCPMFSRFSFERTTFLPEYFCWKKMKYINWVLY